MANTDMYIKSEGDPGYIANVVELYDELDIFLQQIEMLLFTRQRTVLGEPLMGIDIEDQIYNLNVSQGILRTAIIDQVSTFCPLARKYQFQVSIQFYRGTERDIAVIDIVLQDGRSTGIIIA